MRAAVAGLLMLASAAAGQPDLPPGRGPVPLRPGNPPLIVPENSGPVLPPPDTPPLDLSPVEPPPYRPGLDPLFPTPPGGRNDAGDLPPRPRDDRLIPDDLRPLDPLPRDGDAVWPQRRNLNRDDEYSPRYRFWGYSEEGIRFQPTTISHNRHELDLPIPLLLEQSELFGLSLRVRNTQTATRAILPDSLRLFPKSLWEVSLGVGYLHRFGNGWSAGILPRVGTISDRPFESTRELNLSLIAFVRAPAYLQGDFWNFSILYFPNSTLPFPVPGIAYEWNPDPTLRVSLGVPLSVRWRFLPDWQFDFGYRPLAQVNSRLTYEPRPGFQVYGGYDWDSDGYYLVGRPDRRDLFYLQEMRALGGVRVDVTERLTLDLSGGHLFNRSYGVGRTSLNYRSDRLDARPGGYLSAWLLLQF